ncbi:hypothetical protein [Tianweitania sediminis]|uniref:Uncharacterized protein n=1 Tax=Tianweitania sediminis TaxID=1502156 RepID=A0A8J7RHB1_9HYPH|nr:hypothetical protein [Tianweitania sediminis]MBP0438446.1 hypothetical protein [Tianweitania sediminis]
MQHVPLTADGRFSAVVRPVFPEQPDRHPVVEDMARAMEEVAGSGGGVTEADLIAAGFSIAAIIEHGPAARKLVGTRITRQIRPIERVPEIIVKCLEARSNDPARLDGEPLSDEAVTAWRHFCTARAAYRLDPWVSQGERCLARLRDFLRGLRLSERAANQVINKVAAAQKAAQARRAA